MKKEISVPLSFGILFIPAIFSWFTLRKGYSNVVRGIAFSWLALTIYIMLSAEPNSNALGQSIGYGIIFLGIFLLIRKIKKTSPTITTSSSTTDNTEQDDEDEWKKYNSIEDWKSDLTVIWAGDTDDIEFSYRKDYDSPKERKKVTPKELVFDGNKRVYIKGYCHKTQKDVHFNSEKIETKILAGSTRYDFDEWVERRLKIDIYELNEKYKIWI